MPARGDDSNGRGAWADLFLLETTLCLARASKNREVDWALATVTERISRGELLEIPDRALDRYTEAGALRWAMTWTTSSPKARA